jgi:hypothetical protein
MWTFQCIAKFYIFHMLNNFKLVYIKIKRKIDLQYMYRQMQKFIDIVGHLPENFPQVPIRECHLIALFNI